MREYGPRATDGVTFRIVRGHLPARTRVILSNMYCSVFAGFIGFFGISRYRYIGSVSRARLENPKKRPFIRGSFVWRRTGRGGVKMMMPAPKRCFWRFFRDGAQKSKIPPNQTGCGRSHPRGRARLCMHKGPTKPRGAPRPQNRLLYIQVRSPSWRFFGVFLLFLPGPGPFIGFFHRVSKFQPRGRATICVVRHHTEPRVAPPRNPNVLYF